MVFFLLLTIVYKLVVFVNRYQFSLIVSTNRTKEIARSWLVLKNTEFEMSMSLVKVDIICVIGISSFYLSSPLAKVSSGVNKAVIIISSSKKFIKTLADRRQTKRTHGTGWKARTEQSRNKLNRNPRFRAFDHREFEFRIIPGWQGVRREKPGTHGMTAWPGRTQSGIQSAAIINTAPNNTLCTINGARFRPGKTSFCFCKCYSNIYGNVTSICLFIIRSLFFLCELCVLFLGKLQEIRPRRKQRTVRRRSFLLIHSFVFFIIFFFFFSLKDTFSKLRN